MVRYRSSARRVTAFIACVTGLACEAGVEVQEKAVVDVTLTNASAENVHIMLAGEVFNAGNRIAPESSIERGIAMSHSETVRFQAGRNVGHEDEVFVEVACKAPSNVNVIHVKPGVVFQESDGASGLACANW